MRMLDWLRPGIRVKRWLFLGVIGITSISFGLSFLLREIYISTVEKILATLLILSGCVFIFLSIKYVTKTFLQAISGAYFNISLDSNRLSSLLYEKRILIKGPKIVAIGGGTGLSAMLRGLKLYSSNITAIVTVADDGGSSGILRQDLGILPPGDIRNCVLALADTEPIMEKLLQYRFQDGMLKGQSFGNLFLAAMDGISESFEEAVKKMSDVLAVTGRVLPVTLDDVKLSAELEDGFVIWGESQIGKHNEFHPGKIKKVFLEPGEVTPFQEALDAISEADVIIFGPGSLYTSIIPNLLVDKVCTHIKNSNALKIFVCNVMTQPGETDNYSVYDHIEAIEKHAYKGIIDYCIANTAEIPPELEAKYMEDGASKVRVDIERIQAAGVKMIQGNFVSLNHNFVRHSPEKLAEAVMNLIAEAVLSKDKKRVLDYFYVKDRLKKLVTG
ncbi:MAG: YvcK family protein [Clostridia bacterium]|nr:YvcK family protein [Clostridia bacterium]